MGHVEVFGKFKGEKKFSGTFPAVAELDSKVIKEFQMRPALRRFGKALAKQLGVPAISFNKIEFSCVLDQIPDPPEKKKGRKQ